MDYEPAKLVFVDNTLNTRLKLIKRKHKKPEKPEKPTDKKQYHKEYYENNRDKLLQYQNQYKASKKKPEKPELTPKARIDNHTNALYSKQYYLKHKEHINENSKKRYYLDRDKHIARHHAYNMKENEEGKNRHQIYRERKRREKLENMTTEERKVFDARKERFKLIEGETTLERKQRFDRDYYDRHRHERLTKQNEKRRLQRESLGIKQ